jgi:hypothetical protein
MVFLPLSNAKRALRDVLLARRLNQTRSAEPEGCAHLRAFVLEKTGSGWATAKICTTAPRMFVRFLIVDGHCAVGFDVAIPIVAHWCVAVLPRYLKPDEVQGQSELPSRTLGSAG